eukprot:TRINITY_DN10667_c0_g1_i4.p1 TRINITY_DN10667_c0_g1~~TRINITY_DN10667_c0_g1_i4.p1  ORF type:complete len:501 (-),score=179.11 TRINITY_DN10667_c0_g1_i4:211-1713(-)
MDQVDAAVVLMRDNYIKGLNKTYAQRLANISAIEEFVEKEEDAIFAALLADLGKSKEEAILMEVAGLKGEIRNFKKNLKSWMEPTKVNQGWAVVHLLDHMSTHPNPLGVVLNISAWNYPFSLSLTPIIGAIGAGNTVVLKPSEISPNTAKLFSERLHKYGKLSDVIAIVNGGVQETTKLLLNKFDHILYTGNGMVGRIVMAAAAKHLTPVTLELGGKSPTIVTESVADKLNLVAQRIMWGRFANCGQTCIAPDYVMVPESLEQKLLEELKKVRPRYFGIQAKSTDKGDAKQNEKDMLHFVEDPLTKELPVDVMLQCKSYPRIVNGNHFNRIKKLMVPENGEIFVGGEMSEEDKFIAPTVFTKVNVDSPLMKEEIFGPLLPVIPYKTKEEVAQFINARDKPLALYLFTDSPADSEFYMANTTSGGVTINDIFMHYNACCLPFGGVGESGMGGYHGKHSFTTFSHMKPICHKGLNGMEEGVNDRIRYPPYTASKTKLWKSVL